MAHKDQADKETFATDAERALEREKLQAAARTTSDAKEEARDKSEVATQARRALEMGFEVDTPISVYFPNFKIVFI